MPNTNLLDDFDTHVDGRVFVADDTVFVRSNIPKRLLGLEAVVICTILMAHRDCIKGGDESESALQFFDSEWYRKLLIFLDKPVDFLPKGLARKRMET